jgi:hypothetical protein
MGLSRPPETERLRIQHGDGLQTDSSTHPVSLPRRAAPGIPSPPAQMRRDPARPPTYLALKSASTAPPRRAAPRDTSRSAHRRPLERCARPGPTEAAPATPRVSWLQAAPRGSLRATSFPYCLLATRGLEADALGCRPCASERPKRDHQRWPDVGLCAAGDTRRGVRAARSASRSVPRVVPSRFPMCVLVPGWSPRARRGRIWPEVS